MKKTLSIILAILMIVTTMPMAFAAEIVNSGKFGANDDNLTWTVDSDGLLTISGEGDMKNSRQTNIYNWYYSSVSLIRTVVVEEGVTSIEGSPFYCCSGLTEVTVPKSVVEISDGVFSDIPENVTVNVPCTWNEEMLYNFDSGIELNIEEHEWIHKGGNVYCKNCSYLCNHFHLSEPECSKCGYLNIIEDESKTVLDVSKGDIVISDSYVTLNGEYIDVDPEGYIITGVSTGSECPLKIINDSDAEKTFDLVFRNLLLDPEWYPIIIDDNSPVVINILIEGSFSVTEYQVFNCPDYYAKNGITVNITRPEGAVIDFKDLLFDSTDINFCIYLNGKAVGHDMHFHENTDGIQTCMGYACDHCWCYFGEKDESLHITDGEQTCAGYFCSFCRYYFGEPDNTAHSWFRGHCYTCNSDFPEDMECAHEWKIGRCEICGVICSHDLDENLFCTVCECKMSFEVTTGDSVKYYNVFDDLIYELEDGSVVKLINDCLYDRVMYFGTSKKIVLDLNGHTWEPEYLSLQIYSSDTKIMDSVGGGYMGILLYLEAPATVYDGLYKHIRITGDFDLPNLITGCCDIEVGSIGDYNDDYYKDYYDVTVKGEHDIKVVEAKAPTCTESGWNAYEYCTACTYTTCVEIPENGHTALDAVRENEVVAECGKEGSYDLVVYCDDCDDELERDTFAVDALTHTDADGDFLCDNGCGYEFEKPAEDETSCEDCGEVHSNIFLKLVCKLITLMNRIRDILIGLFT